MVSFVVEGDQPLSDSPLFLVGTGQQVVYFQEGKRSSLAHCGYELV